MPQKSSRDKIVDQIVNLVSPIAVNLFGSAARGESANDLDFLIIIPDRKAHLVRQLAHQLYKKVDRFGIPCDFIVLSKEKYLECSQDYSSVVSAAAKEGRWLHGSEPVQVIS